MFLHDSLEEFARAHNLEAGFLGNYSWEGNSELRGEGVRRRILP
jgi:hypothetical protein